MGEESLERIIDGPDDKIQRIAGWGEGGHFGPIKVFYRNPICFKQNKGP